MTYQQTLDYLYNRLPMFQREGKLRAKQSLATIEALLEGLGNPEQKFQSVHVAGTNGKGTVSHTLSALATASGLKTGLYTSPHYVDFRERIRIDGTPVSPQFIVDFVAKHHELIESVSASFFEVTVAMAFYFFAQEEVDVAIIEVGLGGRLDSTNVILPLLSVITNIDLDHTDVLGDSLPEIAREKAGVIKSNVPVIIGRYQVETWPVFVDIANSKNAPIELASDRVHLRENGTGWEISYLAKGEIIETTQIDLHGPFLQENVSTALAAWDQLVPLLGVPWLPIPKGLSAISALSGYRGRFTTVRDRPKVIADAGHNLSAWKEVALRIHQQKEGQLHVVCGYVKGKPVVDFARAFGPNAHYYLGNLDLPRNADQLESAAALQTVAKNVSCHESIARAYEVALQHANLNDLIFVGGSTFVVGALFEYLENQSADAS